MNDKGKTKAQLIQEIELLRQQVHELEAMKTSSEQAMAEEHSKLKTYLENLPLLIYSINFDGTIADCNNLVLQTLGFGKKEDLIGKPLIPTVYAPDSQKKAARLFEEWKKGKKLINEELQIITKEGVIRDVLLNADTIYDLNGNPIHSLSTHLDITERKRAEDSLRESEKNLRLAQEIGKIGNWSWHIPSGLVEWSDQVYEIFKAPPTEPSYELAKSFVHPDDLNLWQTTVQQAVEKEKPFTLDYRAIRSDGETIWVHNETQAEFNEMGKFTGYRGTVQDITERKRWETDLLKSETKYRTLVENLQEGIWIIDRDANTTFVNEPMAKMLGYDEEEMMGRHLFNFMDESGVERAKQYLGRRKTGIAEQHDFEFLRKDGSKVFALIETTPLYNEKGDYSGALASVMDITERKLAENSLMESETKYRALVEGIPDLVYSYSTIRGGVYYSPNVKSVLGYTVSDLLQNPFLWHDSTHPEDLGRVDAAIQKFRDGKSFVIEYRIKDAKGNWHLFQDRSIGRTLESGEIIIEGVAADITLQREAEERLERSESDYRSLVENALVGVLKTNLKGDIHFYNKAAAKIFGIKSRNDIADRKSVSFYWNAEDREKILDTIKKNGEITNYDLEMKTTTEKSIHVIVNARLDGEEITGFLMDVTSHKEAEEELNLAHLALGQIGESVVITTSGLDELEPTILYVNEAFTNMTGYSAEEVIGKTPRILQGEKTERTLLDQLRSDLSQEKPFFGETINYRKDGTEFVLEWHITPVRDHAGKITNWVAIQRDITERKRTQDEIKKLSSVVEAMNDGVTITDLAGKIEFSNDALLEQIGYNQSELIGNEPSLFLTKVGQTRADALQKQIAKGLDLTHSVEFNVKHKNGEALPLSVNFSVLHDLEGKPSKIIAVSRDISEQKKAEKALGESENRFRTLFEESPISIWEEDFTEVKKYLDNLKEKGITNLRDYFDKHPDEVRNIAGTVRIMGFNKTTLEMYGAENKDELFEKIKEIFGREAFDVFKEELIALSEGKTEFVAESPQYRLSGDKFPVLLKLAVVPGYEHTLSKMIFSIIDLSEIKKAEQALKESEQNFRLLSELSHEAIVLHKLGRIVFANDQYYQMCGYEPEELAGIDALEKTLTPESLILARERVKAGNLEAYKTLALKKNGDEFDVEIHPSVTAYKGEQVSVAVIKDLTETKELEAQIQHAQKMEALGTLVAGVAHEINNPVNLIMFNIPLFHKIWRDLMPFLKEQSTKDPDRKYGGLTFEFLNENMDRLISDMDMATNRIAKIVKGLKDFATKSDTAEKTLMHFEEAVGNARRLAETTLRKSGVALEVDLEDDLPMIDANLQSIEQILLNLIINAVQAINHEKGEIRIALWLNERDGRIYVEVADNGPGIDPSIRDTVFDPFVTTRQTEGGTGLGLSVTYSLVKSHNGEITFKTSKDHGTTFTVSFPVKEPKPTAKILVVDDDVTVQKIFVEALSEKGNYAVEKASNGTEALIKLGTHRPDLLILDILMPEMDGVEVCRAIKDEPELAHIKVILITGHSETPKLDELARLGYTNVHFKPFDLAALLTDVEKELGIRQEAR